MPTVDGVIDDEAQVKLIEAIEDVRKKLTYTGAVKRRSHRWGSLSVFLKASGFSANDDWSETSFIERKFRPIGSYTKHGLKKVLSVACKALLYMLQVVILHKISACCALAVVHKFQNFNEKIRQHAGNFFDAVPMHRKVDIDNFFNKISH